jgi:hypothetical protein
MSKGRQSCFFSPSLFVIISAISGSTALLPGFTIAPTASVVLRFFRNTSANTAGAMPSAGIRICYQKGDSHQMFVRLVVILP